MWIFFIMNESNEAIEYYLKNILEFVREFRWIHDFPMLEIFLTDITCKIPETWREWFTRTGHDELQVSALPIEGRKRDNETPSTLQDFISNCERFSLPYLISNAGFLPSFNLKHCFPLYNADLSENFLNGSQTRLPKRLDVKEVEELSKSRFTSGSNESSNDGITSKLDGKPCFEYSKSLNHGLSELSSNSCEESSMKLGPDDPVWKKLKKLSPKKRHEITRMYSFFQFQKEITNCRRIFDIGSGLGYLDILLRLKCPCKIIGYECSLTNLDSASRFKQECLLHDCPDVEFRQWHMNDDNETIIKFSELAAQFSSASITCEQHGENTLHDDGGLNPGVNVLSLHSCADLSPTMLKCCVNASSNVNSFFMLSCCYHKMKSNEESNLVSSQPGSVPSAKFKNFPLSKTLRATMNDEPCFNKHSLRLASEESKCSWENRLDKGQMAEVNSIAYRAILHNVCEKEGIVMEKLSRKPVKKTSYTSLVEYIDALYNNCKFRLKSEGTPVNKQVISALIQREYSQHEEDIAFVGLLRSLQLHLQPVIEGLILVDRVLYLRENGFSKSGLVRLFDPVISPRSTAVFGFK